MNASLGLVTRFASVVALAALGGCIGNAYAQSGSGNDHGLVCVSRDRANQPCEENQGPDEPPVIEGCPRHTCMQVGGGHATPHEERVTLNVSATRRTRTRQNMPGVCCYNVPVERAHPNG